MSIEIGGQGSGRRRGGRGKRRRINLEREEVE
jgi:hypothetical protein